jgi:hypothetical protein
MPHFPKIFSALLILISSLVITGCHPSSKIIHHVRVKLSENLENITVALVFNHENIQHNLMGNMELKDYGNVFVTPYVANPLTAPEMGFTINTAIIHDREYSALKTTKSLPNGLPIELPNPVVQIHHHEALEKDVELYAYFDAIQPKWIGAAAMLSDDQSRRFSTFGSQKLVFMRDLDSRPAIFARISGPKFNDTGSLEQTAGVAVFLNYKNILAEMAGGTETTYRAEVAPRLRH